MKNKKVSIIAFSLFFLYFSSFLLAADEEKMKVSGNFEFGYRYVDVNGNIDKYYEDLNIRKGPRLLTLNIDILPSEKYKKYFDLFNLYASTIGGDPFESYGFTLKKHGFFNFRYGHRKATYFYKDTILPHDLAYYIITNGGDFHTFSFERNFDNLYFDVRFLERAKFFVSFDRQQKVGESTTTIDISRDEFEFDRPLEELKTEYRGGIQVNLDKVDFYLEGSYRDFENNSRLFLPGYSEGENPSYTELFSFELMAPYEFTMPMITAKVNARPTKRIKATAAYIFSDLDMELDYNEKALGVSSNGSPLEYENIGKADINRKINLFDFDLSFQAHDKVYLIGGFRYNKLDQEGELRVGNEIEDTLVDIRTSIFEVGAQVLPYQTLSVSGGVRFESRKAFHEIEEAGHEEETEKTERTTFFFNANYSLAQKVSLMAEYERGSFKNPFTLMSPTDLNRFKVRAKIRPTARLSLMLTYLRKDLDNDDSGGKFDSNTYSIDASYNLKDKLYVSAGYSRQDIDTSISNVVTYLFQTSTWDILYESGNNTFRGSLKYRINKNLAVGGMAYYYKNSGSWELDWTTFKGWVRYTCEGGYSLLLSYRYNNYNEKKYNFDDYSSNILTIGFGYRF